MKLSFAQLFVVSCLAGLQFALGKSFDDRWDLLNTNRIVGGHEIEVNAAPHQVSLQQGSHYCGGSIISNEWILTAAHCTDNQNVGDISVRIGSSKYYEGGKLVPINKIVQHPRYDQRSVDYDYSLIRLSASLKFDEKKRAIQLPKQNESITDNTRCTVTGWGFTQNSSEVRYTLRQVTVPIVNQAECNEKYDSYGGVTDHMICAGFENGGKDACQGDSGGPLVCSGKLFGVVSWGYGCARPHFPGVYSRVPAIRDWIREVSKV